MKVRIGNYPSRLTCNLYSNYMNKKYGYVCWPRYTHKGLAQPKSQPFAEAWREKAGEIIQSCYTPINYFLDKRTQKVKVKIEAHDTWSMDHTLSYIILPMLKQLKDTKHGAPYVESADVPKELRMNVHQKVAYKKDGTTDKNFFKRWDWVLDEMIYAFDCKANKDDVWMRFDPKTEQEAIDKEQERISNGFRLFGKYYESLWD